jgi:hypothetical protein
LSQAKIRCKQVGIKRLINDMARNKLEAVLKAAPMPKLINPEYPVNPV